MFLDSKTGKVLDFGTSELFLSTNEERFPIESFYSKPGHSGRFYHDDLFGSFVRDRAHKLLYGKYFFP